MALTLADWRLDSSTSDCGNCGGGWYKFFVTERSDIDFDNVVVTSGQITALPLLVGANLVRVFPQGVDATTGEYNGTREDSFSPLVYEPSISFAVSPTGNFVAEAEGILKSLCDPVIIACTNCCEVLVFNIELVECNGVTELRQPPSPMRLNEVTRSFGTVTSKQERTWTFSGTTFTPETYTTLACSDFDALVTAG